MLESVKTHDMLNYIQALFTEYLANCEKYGRNGIREKDLLQQLLGMKTMVENLFGTPVNLQRDGKVTTGLW